MRRVLALLEVLRRLLKTDKRGAGIRAKSCIWSTLDLLLVTSRPKSAILRNSGFPCLTFVSHAFAARSVMLFGTLKRARRAAANPDIGRLIPSKVAEGRVLGPMGN